MVSYKKITIRKRNIVVFMLWKILFVIQLDSFCWRSSYGCRRYFKNQTLHIYYICINSKSIQVCYGCFDLAELIILKKIKKLSHDIFFSNLMFHAIEILSSFVLFGCTKCSNEEGNIIIKPSLGVTLIEVENAFPPITL